MAGDIVGPTFFSREKKVDKEKRILKFFGTTFLSRKVVVLVLVFGLSGVAFAHNAMNKFWGEVPVDMLLTGDVLIVRPLVVPEGVTLTIDPGTVVRFERRPNGDNRITVRGRLVAAGTRDKTIRFVPKDSSSGQWRGIEFEGSGTGRIENCTFEKASKGITDPGGKVRVRDVSFK